MADHSSDIHLVNLTIRNTTRGQAEGLLMAGERNIVSHATILGSGDARQVNGSVYLTDRHDPEPAGLLDGHGRAGRRVQRGGGSDAGTYAVTVTNASGTTTSRAATLTVRQASLPSDRGIEIPAPAQEHH